MSTPTQPKRVLGIDPGYERLGLAILERDGGGERVITSLCLRTKSDLSFAERLGILSEGVRELIEQHTPDTLAMERIFFNQSTSTALGVAEVRGMLQTLAHAYNLAVYEYSPQQVKVAVTGYGGSDKKAVAQMITTLLRLPTAKRLDDEVDAIAVGVTCLSSTRSYPQS